MQPPRHRLLDALEAWARDHERERVARWRGDRDAEPEARVAARHPDLATPRVREWFEAAVERGELPPDEQRVAARFLRRARVAAQHATLRSRIAAVDGARVPYDSDHFAAHDLFDRAALDPRPRERARILAALDPHLQGRARVLSEALAEAGGALEDASWLTAIDPVPDDVVPPLDEPSARLLAGTDAVFQELLERLGHRAKLRIETVADLGHALRAPAFDAVVDGRTRWRRLAALLRPSGLASSLERRVRSEPYRGRGQEAAISCLAPPRDVRVRPGREMGIASERSALRALGSAIAITSTHEASHPLLSRPAAGTVGATLGALFAHLLGSTRFVQRTLRLDAPRTFAETALAHELVELRLHATRTRVFAERGGRGFADAARTFVSAALGVEVSEAVAENLVLAGGDLSGGGLRQTHLRALRAVPALYETLRDRYDEDFYDNPRLLAVVRGAAARGAGWSVEAWMHELEVPLDGRAAARYGELLESG